MKPELPESTKKPYEAPELFVYGDVREISVNDANDLKRNRHGRLRRRMRRSHHLEDVGARS